MAFILDTNIVINYLDASLPVSGMKMLDKIVDDEPIISVITKMETLGFKFKSISEENTMETFINASTILEVSNLVVNKTIVIRKNKKINLPDAIIAASAIVFDLTLITRNVNDFKNIEGLKLIDPWDV
jgi:predicted nucleic acid-binding protein